MIAATRRIQDSAASLIFSKCENMTENQFQQDKEEFAET